MSFPNQTRGGLNLIGYNNSRGNTKSSAERVDRNAAASVRQARREKDAGGAQGIRHAAAVFSKPTFSRVQCWMSAWTLLMGFPWSQRCSRFVSDAIDAGTAGS